MRDLSGETAELFQEEMMLQKMAALVGAAGLVCTMACAKTDAGISTNVKSKMAVDDTVKAYQIDVDTQNGVVTLSGAVDSSLAKERAVQIARTTDGVRDVVDRITVSESTATGGLLDRDNDIDAHDTAKPEDRDISGTLREAGRDARDTARNAANRTAAVAGDAAITSAVKAKFLADTNVSGLRIDVDTSDGVVTLTGNVSSKAEADRAMMLARNTEGVKRIIDRMKIAK
jgi:hyperosmotically inducible periplasmic protein